MSAVAKCEAALEQERQHVGELEVTLKAALDRRAELADDPAGFAKNERAVADLQAELLRRREYALPRREADLAEARAKQAHADWDEAGKALVSAQKRRHDVSGKFAATFKELLVLARQLERARARVGEAEFKARVPSDVDEWQFPSESRDEPDWPDVGDLLDVLQAGPRQPDRKLQAELARLDRTATDMRKRKIPDAVEAALHGSRDRLERLTGDERAEAERRLACAQRIREHARQLKAEWSPGQGPEAFDRRRFEQVMARAIAGDDVDERDFTAERQRAASA